LSNISFNPFNRDLEELEPSDLAVLREKAEGWFIEYKSEVVSVKKIAKSLAAFANHYGGWIFYGVKEADDGSHLAGSFPGLDRQEVLSLIESIRNAAKDVVSPSPYYDHKILDGPCSEIGLLDEKSIVVVAVPSSPDTPYIHSDGRIYRRIADSSDPKPETDRFTLDHLWQRGQRARDKLASFLEKEPILSEAESERSFIDIFLLPDPLGASGQSSRLTFSRFVELMSDPNAPGINMPYDNFYTMPDGFIGRWVGTNPPFNLVVTWRHFRNGFSLVSIPFSSVKLDTPFVEEWLHSYEQEKAILELIHRGRYHYGHLLNINQLIFLVLAVVRQQKRLMEEGKIREPLYAKAALHNVWRRIPLLDTETFIRFTSEYGLPVIQFNDEFAPPDKTFESLRRIPEKESPEGDHPMVIQGRESALLVADILDALGLPAEEILGSPTEEFLAEPDWWSAALRHSVYK
jgi:hypothetical protein